MRRLDTTYATLTWSVDASRITKARPPGDEPRRRFTNELRVNQMLRTQRPAVPTPSLVDHNVRARTLTFEAIPGEPLGPKYPHHLAGEEIDATIALAQQLRDFAPRRPWFHRLSSSQRLGAAARAGLLSDYEVASLVDLADRCHAQLHFAHGDLTARNILRTDDHLWLIDWEWAGLYPPGYELAFLWFSLVDVEGARAHVEQVIDVDERAFFLSALLIQLWHLQWHVPTEFRAKHLATRDSLVARLGVYRSCNASGGAYVRDDSCRRSRRHD